MVNIKHNCLCRRHKPTSIFIYNVSNGHRGTVFATAFTTTNSWQGFYWFKSFQLEKFKIKLGVTWAMSKLFKHLMAYLIVIENNYNIYFNKMLSQFFYYNTKYDNIRHFPIN